jgi:hypothetical protein
LLLVVAFAGCGREQIQVYRIPKEAVQWLLPAGWQERPADKMRVASFSVVGKDGQEADVAVVPLKGAKAADVQFVNLWREQVKLPPIGEADVAGQAEKVPVGPREGKLYEIAGTEPVIDGKYPERILVAMLNEADAIWFFKMAGPDGLVREQKTAFLQFLKSISSLPEVPDTTIEERPMSTNSREAPHQRAESGLPAWNVPANWQQLPPSPMLRAKFLVPGAGPGKAEVNISVAGGGALMNINRWRGQLGLAPVGEGDLEQLARPLDVPGAKAIVVDMSGTDVKTGQPARMLAVMVPQGEQSWFFKLMGDPTVVEKEKAAFLQFVQTTKYSDAP